MTEPETGSTGTGFVRDPPSGIGFAVGFDSARARSDATNSGIDERAVAAATKMLLHAIGEDPDREGLRETPERVARAWAELTAGMREDPADHLAKTFDGEGDPGLILQRDISFYSLCEHHLVPFHGTAGVAYIPNKDNPRLVGLSKLARLVQGYAKRLQVQERMTHDILAAIEAQLKPYGACVVLRAEHLCMGMRGIKVPGSVTVTSGVHGIFKDDAKAREEVMALLA